jgi:sn-glycerol 3-phosphate transport system permease protein
MHLGSYIALSVLLIIVLFPVYYVLVGSLMFNVDLFSTPPKLFPFSGLNFANYAEVLTSSNLIAQYGNSVLVAVLVTVAQVITATLAAYALVFTKLRGKKIWFGLCMATMMVPWEAIIIPNFLNLSSWGLIGNNWFGAILAMSLPFMATGFSIFLMRQAFMTFPVELHEAAILDGAGHGRFLFSVLLPVSKPSLAALAIYSFLNTWNMYFWPLLVARNSNQQTIQIGITQFNSAEMFDPGVVMASVFLAVLPVLIIVIFGQRFIVRGLTAGALK